MTNSHLNSKKDYSLHRSHILLEFGKTVFVFLTFELLFLSPSLNEAFGYPSFEKFILNSADNKDSLHELIRSL